MKNVPFTLKSKCLALSLDWRQVTKSWDLILQKWVLAKSNCWQVNNEKSFFEKELPNIKMREQGKQVVFTSLPQRHQYPNLPILVEFWDFTQIPTTVGSFGNFHRPKEVSGLFFHYHETDKVSAKTRILRFLKSISDMLDKLSSAVHSRNLLNC